MPHRADNPWPLAPGPGGPPEPAPGPHAAGRAAAAPPGRADRSRHRCGRPEARRGARLHAPRARAMPALLDALCAELPMLRAPAIPRAPRLGPVGAPHGGAPSRPTRLRPSSRPWRPWRVRWPTRCWPPCCAPRPLDRAFVNNGGDIALHCAPATHLALGLDRSARPAEPVRPGATGPRERRGRRSPPAAGAGAPSRAGSPIPSRSWPERQPRPTPPLPSWPMPSTYRTILRCAARPPRPSIPTAISDVVS